jgi:hypothetical protein
VDLPCQPAQRVKREEGLHNGVCGGKEAVPAFHFLAFFSLPLHASPFADVTSRRKCAFEFFLPPLVSLCIPFHRFSAPKRLATASKSSVWQDTLSFSFF